MSHFLDRQISLKLLTIFCQNHFRRTVYDDEKRKRRNIVSENHSGRSDTKTHIRELVIVKQTNASTYAFTLDKLRHFSMYSISVQACLVLDDPISNANTLCSNAVVLNRRTAKIGFPLEFNFL